MKEKLFDYMRVIGWNLGDNTNEDFDGVMQLHLKRMENRWERLTKDDTLTDETLVEDLAFMIDLVRAINDRDNYVLQIEDGLMNSLDKLSALDENFDYYDTLREVSGLGNYQALDFLDRLGSDDNGNNI